MLLVCSFFKLKELFQEKNGLTKSLLFFFENAENLGRTTLKGEKKEDGRKRIRINRVSVKRGLTVIWNKSNADCICGVGIRLIGFYRVARNFCGF